MDEIREANKKAKDAKNDVSRRKFLSRAVAGAGATAVTVLSDRKTPAPDRSESKAIRVLDEFDQAARLSPVKASFPMAAAQVFARVCKEEGLAALFCCP